MNNNEKLITRILLIFLAIIFWPVAILLFFIKLIYLATKSEIKRQSFSGNDAEYTVSERLHELDENHYTVFDNICLPSNGNTKITQIDHIVVSEFGIFCIETKGQIGWIFGSKNRKYWTEVIYRNKYKLYNPLWQNYAHTKAIENLLGDKLKTPIIPLIVFPNSEKVQIDECEQNYDEVETLDAIVSYTASVYGADECVEICNMIDSANITDKEKIYQHNIEVERFSEIE